MDVTTHDAEFVIEVMVHAQQFLSPGQRFDSRVDKKIAAVRRRNKCIQQRLGIRINRNGVSGKWTMGAWINRALLTWANIAKVPAALGDRRHLLIEAEWVPLSPPFLRPEEKCLVTILVVARQNHRTADCVTEVMLFIRRAGIPRIVVKPIVCVK